MGYYGNDGLSFSDFKILGAILNDSCGIKKYFKQKNVWFVSLYTHFRDFFWLKRVQQREVSVVALKAHCYL